MLLILVLAPVWNADLTPIRRAALGGITAKALSADVAYLADDRLEGRATPSKGLDLAADFTATAFKRAGLQSKGDDGYFQTTEYGGAKVRNVVGLLKGSDPKLRQECVMVTAHDDHLGVRPDVPGTDKVYNGANDDASGTAGVMALARALGRAKPKRSVLFVLFWGEERGLLGSTYDGAHPVVPLAKTVADVDLEQIGRTDDAEGPRVNAVGVTGYDYSDVTAALVAGKTLGTEVQKHPRYSDPFFLRSDNRALALAGVPAHTISVAFEFPDYHGPDDEADRLDYDDMTKVVRLAGLGVLALADAPQSLRWNADDPKTARYRRPVAKTRPCLMNPSATLPTPEDPTPKGSHDSLPIDGTEPKPSLPRSCLLKPDRRSTDSDLSVSLCLRGSFPSIAARAYLNGDEGEGSGAAAGSRARSESTEVRKGQRLFRTS